jgi:predicted YcjX-like family ATPase
VLEFQRRRRLGSGLSRLTLDIVDYPGEWLLDLPLLQKSYGAWAAETLAASREGTRIAIAGPWHAHLATLDPAAKADEAVARMAAQLFTDYLRAGRDARFALSTLPPGRFLMPGDLEGSPALTFAPLDVSAEASAPSGSLHAMMERRYEAYKQRVIKPFFVDHFARLDRQIVLVDALAAFNAGPQAVRDLETALTSVLSSFRVGANSWISALFRPRVQKILFAATMADHLHHRSHDRLEAILRRLADGAIERASFAGAAVDVVALASVRATREATIRQGRAELPCIIGTPIAGESSGDEVFDGESEAVVFPGDLPDDPSRLFDPGAFAGLESAGPGGSDFRFIRFRPPRLEPHQVLPHIRLDRTLEFLIGDRLGSQTK